MRFALDKYWVLLLAQVVVLAVVLGGMGRLGPLVNPDTESYLSFPFHNLTDALSDNRTAGYPLFLKAVGAFAPSLDLVPLCQYLAYAMAVCVFYAGFRNVAPSPASALAVASSLLYSNLLLRYVSNITADVLGLSLAIVSISLLLFIATRAGGRAVWYGLALFLFLSYQTRPVYLFLVVLVPALGVALRYLIDASGIQKTQWLRYAATLAVTAILPLVLYSALRWAAVGQFALVSFGGHNLAGLTGQFLDRDLADELPSDLRPLANKALERKRQLDFPSPIWSPDQRWSYAAIESRWDAHTWLVFQPAARELYGDDPILVNSRLRQLGTAIVCARPGRYAAWLAKAFLQGVRLAVAEFFLNPVYAAWLVVLGIAHSCSVVHRLRARVDVSTVGSAYFTAWNGLLLIAVGFTLTNVLLVILTSPPQGRFTDAAGVFLPALIALATARAAAVCRLTR